MPGQSRATRPNAAMPLSTCFHELIARPSPWIPALIHFRPTRPASPRQKPLSTSLARGVARPPQSLDNDNSLASQLFLGNNALKAVTELRHLNQHCHLFLSVRKESSHVPEPAEPRQSGIGQPDRCHPRRDS